MNREKQVTATTLDNHQHAEPPRFMLFALLRETQLPTDAVPPPPDGGLQAWTQVAMAHLILFCTWGFINSFGFFQAYYEENLGSGVSASQISWVASVQVFLLSFIGSFSGRLMDAGYYRYCLIGGFTFQIIGIFMISLCTQYWQVFLAQGLCCGIGDGLLFCPTTALIATYFVKKRRSIALGLTLSGSSTGGLIFPILVQQLLPKIGFTWTIRCIGFVVIFCFFICLSLARPRLPKKTNASAPLVEPSAFRELPYSLFVIGIFLTLWAVYFSYFYINSYAVDVIGTSNSESLSMLYIINGLGIPGRIIPALVADRYFGGILNMYIILGIIAGILLYCWMAVKSYGGMIAFIVCYGLIGGGVQGTALSSLPMLTTDLSKMGVRSGMVLSIVSFACLTGPPLAGALIQRDNGSYVYACAWGGLPHVEALSVVCSSLLFHDIETLCYKSADYQNNNQQKMPSLTTADPLLGPHSHPQLVTALKSARETFTAANPESRLAYSEATRYFPGGNTRTLLHSLPFPLTFQSAHSCYLTSIDNATYIDFCSEYTSGLFGHSHPVIKNAIEAVLTTGWNYGGLNDRERHFAKLVCERFHLDKVRFTNSGTEASMMAIAAAMNFTNRDRILVFTNGFHGSTINFPTPAPAKSIVLPLKFVVAPFNDIEGTKGIISRQPEHSLAAIFVEPVQGAGGAIPASVEFLRFLREAATASSAVYIIDETMTSRLAYHGRSFNMGIEADLMTLGKWIGGGMTFGAFGGREDIMSQFDQNTGSLAHSGTFNNNVFSMTAGLAGLQLIDESAIERVNTLGDEMRLQLQEILRRHGVYDSGTTTTEAVPRMYVRGLGSMLAVHFSGQYALIFKGLFFHHLLTHGIYIASRGFISLSIEITQDHVQRFSEAFERFVALYAAFLLVEEQAGKVNSQL